MIESYRAGLRVETGVIEAAGQGDGVGCVCVITAWAGLAMIAGPSGIVLKPP
jgi:hypothetical protein